MTDPALARQAGRFVWLELDFDKPVNQEFLERYGVSYTPTLYVLDAPTEKAKATHVGGMTIAELNRFLDGAAAKGGGADAAQEALTQGDDAFGRGRWADAAAAYRESLKAAAPSWSERPHAVAALAWALWVGHEPEPAVALAAAEAPAMKRGPEFVRVVLAGLGSANAGGDATWAQSGRQALVPLAEEAIGVPGALRDHRFQLYQNLMRAAERRGDTVSESRISHRWLDEIDAIVPKSDDERSALDIARVDAACDDEGDARVIPKLQASERAMPTNYNASLRLAQVEIDAKRYDEAIAACDRGIGHATGPVGRSWLLRTKAEALTAKGERERARAALSAALDDARGIGNPSIRENNVRHLEEMIAKLR